MSEDEKIERFNHLLKARDVYQLGWVIFNVLTGKQPYDSPQKRVDPKATFDREALTGIASDRAIKLLTDMLYHDPDWRIGSEQLLSMIGQDGWSWYASEDKTIESEQGVDAGLAFEPLTRKTTYQDLCSS